MRRTLVLLLFLVALFTVGCKSRDRIGPEVVSTFPPYGSTEVEIDLEIRITFSEAMRQSQVEAAFTAEPALTASASWDGNTLVIRPEFLFPGTEYVLSFSSPPQDLAGNSLADFSLRFTTVSPASSIYSIEDFIWLPDGSGLLFAATIDGQSAIWRVNLADNTQVLFADGDFKHLAASSHGEILAACSGSEPLMKLLSLLDGEVLDTIAVGDTGVLASPQFSPDGSDLVFLAVFGYADAHSDLYQETIWWRDGQVHRLSPTGETDWLLGFSATGEGLYILSTHNSMNHSRDFRYDVYLVNPSGEASLRLTTAGPIHNYHSGVFAAVDKVIIYADWQARESEYTILMEPGRLHSLELGQDPDPLVISEGRNAYPVLCPVGPLLAYIHNPPQEGEGWDIYLRAWPDGGVRRLTHSSHRKTGLQFSPQGNLLAFVETRGESQALWIVGLDGAGLRRLTR